MKDFIIKINFLIVSLIINLDLVIILYFIIIFFIN